MDVKINHETFIDQAFRGLQGKFSFKAQ